MVVVLLGPPGVGKGTQAVRLADSEGAAHISTGDLLRAARREGTELGRKAQAYMDSGELVPDDLILELVREHLGSVAADRSVLFDGFPRTTVQADGLDAVLESAGRRVDLVVLFTAPDETLIKRLSGRRSCPACGAIFNTYFSPPSVEGICDRCAGTLVHRKDDEPETVARRLDVYREQTSPLVAYYEAHAARMLEVRADRSAEEVYQEFHGAVVAGAA